MTSRTVVTVIVLIVFSIVHCYAFECLKKGSFAKEPIDGCVDYIICSTVGFPKECPEGTIFNPTSSQCETSECSYQNKTITKPQLSKKVLINETHREPKTFICTKQGRFSNPDVPNCVGYIYCSKTTTKAYTQFHFTCLNSLKFDPSSSQCSSRYRCPKEKKTNKKQIISFTTRRPTFIIKQVKPTIYVKGPNANICPKIGRIPDPTVPGCRGYVMCTKPVNGKIRYYKFQCGGKTTFEPHSGICQSNYVCPSAKVATTSTTTTTVRPTAVLLSVITTARAMPKTTRITSTTSRTTTTPPVSFYIQEPRPTVFTCPSVGRFPDTTVPKCKGYILCLPTPGLLGKFTCNGKSSFDPTIQECSVDYECPWP